MMYHRGPASDFDEWGITLKGWTYQDLLPYFLKSENFNPAPHGTPLATFDPAWHGVGGPWQVSYSYLHPVSESFVNACESLGVKRNPDFNSKHGTLGVNRMQT